MATSTAHSPVIFVVESNYKTKQAHVREWLDHSRFVAGKAHEIFDILDDISDFTGECRPDVYMIEVDSLVSDLPGITRFVQMTAMHEVPVVAYKGVETLAEIEAVMNEMIPQCSAATAGLH